MRIWIFLLAFGLAAATGVAARGRAPRHREHESHASSHPPPAPPARSDERGDALPPGAFARLGSLRFRHPPAAHGVAFQGARTLVSAGAGLASFAVPPGKPGRGAGRPERALWRLAISGDGKRAAAGQLSGAVTVIDLATGAEAGSERSPGGPLVALAYPRAGQAALGAWQDGAVRWISPKGAFTRERFWLDAPLRAVALAADGKTLAVSHGGRLEIRDAHRGALVRAFDAPPPEVRALALSPDGATLACLTAEGIALFAVATGALERSIELDEEGHGPHQLAFGPDGTWLAVAAHPGVVQVIDVKTGATRVKIAAAAPGLTRRRPTFAIQPGGALIATTGLGVTLRLWDAKTGAEVSPLPGHRDAVEQVAFAPGAALVATAGADGTVRLWSAAGAEERQVVTARASGLGFLADGQLIAWGPAKDALAVIDVASGTRLAEVKPPPVTSDIKSPGGSPATPVTSDIKSASGSTPVTSDIKSPSGSTPVTSDIKSPSATPAEPDDPPPFAMAPPAALTAPPPAPEAEPAYLGAQLPLVRGVAGHVQTLWPDALALPEALGQAGATVRAALGGDRAALDAFGAAPAPAPVDPPRLVSALCGETGVLGIASGSAVRLHDARSGVLAKQLTTGAPVTALAFAPDGSALLAGGADGAVSLHDVASGERRAQVPPVADSGPVRAVAFGADGQTYAWVTASGSVGVGRRSSADLARFDGGQALRVRDLALSPDGRWLATAGGDGTHVFELVTRQEIAHLLGHAGDVVRVTFSPDSRQLATASADGTVLLWDAQRFEQLIR